MKELTGLNPRWIGLLRPGPASGEGLSFDCPVCGPSHTLVAYFDNPIDGGEAASWSTKWKRVGSSFTSVTLEPSIEYPCFHGWIEKGNVYDVSESPLTVVTPKGRYIALSPNQAAMLARNKLGVVGSYSRFQRKNSE